MRIRYLGLLVFGLASCAVGPRAATFAPARSPGGAEVRLDLGTGKPVIVGELIAVQDTALLILEGNVVKFVPLALIKRGGVTAPGSRARIAPRPNSLVRQRVRLLSRYPKGVNAELLRRLLDAYGQADLAVVAP